MKIAAVAHNTRRLSGGRRAGKEFRLDLLCPVEAPKPHRGDGTFVIRNRCWG